MQEYSFQQYIFYGDIYTEITENEHIGTPLPKATIWPILCDNWKTIFMMYVSIIH